MTLDESFIDTKIDVDEMPKIKQDFRTTNIVRNYANVCSKIFNLKTLLRAQKKQIWNLLS